MFVCLYFEGGLKQLFPAKTKLSPVKTTSVPRLELYSARLLARPFHSISGFLNLLPLRPYPFTDSSVVLGGLNTQSNKLKTFIANRKVEITELTSTSSWCHVVSKLNPPQTVISWFVIRETFKP